jgi:hypothetical protein
MIPLLYDWGATGYGRASMGVLRKIFGPGKDEVWKQLCTEIGAEFVQGGFWDQNKVQVHVKDWTVTLDTFVMSTGKSSMPFTRMRAPYVNNDGFRFKVYRSGVFTELGKILGMQDIEVGHSEFDREFVIKANDPVKVHLLFGNPEIRRLLEEQPSISLEVKDAGGWFGTSFPEGVDELYFQVGGVITDIERLKLLFELFSVTLNHLCHIGSAYEDDPKLALK